MFDISPSEFRSVQSLLLGELGIRLNDSRSTLVRSRLMKRLRRLGIPSYGEYFDYATNAANGEEKSILIDLLTTHETRFFREKRHFDHLQTVIEERASEADDKPLRVWSAACSSGEEAYSAALVCARSSMKAWRILASDVSRSVVEKAERGVFDNRRLSEIGDDAAARYFLRGVRTMKDYFAAGPELRDHMEFHQINLVDLPRNLPVFDVIFLSNVLIYFDAETRRATVENVLHHLTPGGYLYVGAAESLNGISEDLLWRGQSIYQKMK